MNGLLTAFVRASSLTILILAAMFGTGCQAIDPTAPSNPAKSPSSSDGGPDNVLRLNDLVTLMFSGLTSPPPRHEERIKDDGTITPSSLFPPVKAAGKTPLQLQRELQQQYDRFYRNLTVTVSTELRFFYVAGDVRRPDRYTYPGETTVLSAITTAGGFTDFAARRRVQLIRANGQKIRVDCIKALQSNKLDLPVYPGDKIEVPRRIM